MSVQTEIKQEKALFAELGKKVKQSKSIKREETKNPKTGDIKIKYSMDKINILITKEGFSVKNKQNKLIVKMDTVVPDVEGDALELCEARAAFYHDLLETLELRDNKEQEKLDRLEAVKKAAQRFKASKDLRKKQQAEAVMTLKALDTIRGL